MKEKISLVFILLITITSTCQTIENSKGFDYGEVENNIYSNSFFDFKVTIPQDWIVQSRELTENLKKVGKEIIAGDNENLKAAINASEINSAFLITVFQYELGSAVDYNPGFVVIAENLKFAPGIKTGGDYLFHTRKLLRQAQMPYENIDDEFEKINIDNHDFYIMNADLNYMGKIIKQSYYSTILNGFSITAVISFVNDEQKNILQETVNSINFDE